VKAEHGPPAGLLYPLGTVGLDFLDMPTAASGHDFLQVHINFLTGRVWLVPTHKTATATTAASNFVGSVFRDVGIPDVLVSDRDTRFTSEFWPALYAALGTTLVFGSPHHHNTNAKTERVNGAIADVLRSFVSERQDDWPALLPLVEFAINDCASPCARGMPRSTPTAVNIRADLFRHLWTRPQAPSPAALLSVAQLMDHVTGEKRALLQEYQDRRKAALLQEHQDRRKAALDQRRRDVAFEVGDEVLLDTTHTPLPSRDKLSARWMGPFKILAKTAPNTYRLAVPAAWRAFNEFNVERLENLTNCEEAMAHSSGLAASSFPAALPLPRWRW